MLGVIILELKNESNSPPKNRNFFKEPQLSTGVSTLGEPVGERKPSPPENLSTKNMTKLGGVSIVFQPLLLRLNRRSDLLHLTWKSLKIPDRSSLGVGKFFDTPHPGIGGSFKSNWVKRRCLEGAAFPLRCEKWTHGPSEEKPGELSAGLRDPPMLVINGVKLWEFTGDVEIFFFKVLLMFGFGCGDVW